MTFVVPADWQGGEVRVGCSARGKRRLLLLKHDATLGRAAGDVRLHRTDGVIVREVAKPVVADAEDSTPTTLPYRIWNRPPPACDNIIEMTAGANAAPKQIAIAE